MALFELGQMVATPTALKFCNDNQIEVLKLLARHANGDWGDVSKEDKATNTAAISNGGRIFSAYQFGKGRVWVITEAAGDDGKRASTCVLLPQDY